MLRRSLLLLAAGPLAACRPDRTDEPVAASPGTTPRAAVADHYRWFALDRDLTRGFCFTWVHGLVPRQVLDRLGGKELERVRWEQLVGSGDGQRGRPDRSFFGVARVDRWSLIVEDGGDLGTTDRLLIPLSRGTTLISHHHAADGHGRFLLLEDGQTRLNFDPLTPGRRTGSRAAELAPLLGAVGFGIGDPGQPTAAALALTERLTGIAMTQELLRDRTYLLTTVQRR